MSINDELPEDFPPCPGPLAEDKKHLFVSQGTLIDTQTNLGFELFECAACGGNLMVGGEVDD